MQIDLSPEIEGKLAAESAALGITPVELSVRVLAQHVDQWFVARKPEDAGNRKARLEEFVEWMKSQNPNYESQDPYATDWQAIKAEGRRY